MRFCPTKQPEHDLLKRKSIMVWSRGKTKNKTFFSPTPFNPGKRVDPRFSHLPALKDLLAINYVRGGFANACFPMESTFVYACVHVYARGRVLQVVLERVQL